MSHDTCVVEHLEQLIKERPQVQTCGFNFRNLASRQPQFNLVFVLLSKVEVDSIIVSVFSLSNLKNTKRRVHQKTFPSKRE